MARKSAAEKITRANQLHTLKGKYIAEFGTKQQKANFQKQCEKQLIKEKKEDFQNQWKKLH